MKNNCKCPYCGVNIKINHDGGYGYEDEILHQQQCGICDKYFTYTTGIIYVYESFKADCLNDGNHDWQPTITVPREYTKMQCSMCDEERKPTEEEMKHILEENK